MKILYTAFKGSTNSSKILLDNIKSTHKLYLTNSFETSVKELIKELNNNYDLIISFGQSTLALDTIKIETTASGEEEYKTNYNHNDLVSRLENNYKVIISDNAGNYLCNNIYYYGLKYIKDNNLKTKMIFIHIPKKDKISNVENLAKHIIKEQ